MQTTASRSCHVASAKGTAAGTSANLQAVRYSGQEAGDRQRGRCGRHDLRGIPQAQQVVRTERGPRYQLGRPSPGVPRSDQRKGRSSWRDQRSIKADNPTRICRLREGDAEAVLALVCRRSLGPRRGKCARIGSR